MNKKKNKVLKKDSQVQEFTRGYGYSFEDLSNSSNKNKMVDKIKIIGDKVWVLDGDKIKRARIESITYVVRIEGSVYPDNYESTRVFDSKEELLESLSK